MITGLEYTKPEDNEGRLGKGDPVWQKTMASQHHTPQLESSCGEL